MITFPTLSLFLSTPPPHKSFNKHQTRKTMITMIEFLIRKFQIYSINYKKKDEFAFQLDEWSDDKQNEDKLRCEVEEDNQECR